MADLSSTAEAQTYATTVLSALNSTVSDVTSWLDLPSNVATGLLAQYNLQANWLTQDIGQLEIILTMLGNGNNDLGIQVALQHPWSRGTIFINSTSAFDKPLINPDYFGVGYDIDIMNQGSVFARRLASTNPMNTIMLSETTPGSSYTSDTLNTYIKTKAGTEYHPLGTCSMLPQSSGGVVDTNLLVYGSSNLRVIDASIIPIHISAHLMASTYGIAEKGADIIKGKYMALTSTSTNTTAVASGAGSSTSTKSVGKATDSSVTEADSNLAGLSGMSMGTKIGIGAGAGVGAAVLIGALVCPGICSPPRNVMGVWS